MTAEHRRIRDGILVALAMLVLLIGLDALVGADDNTREVCVEDVGPFITCTDEEVRP